MHQNIVVLSRRDLDRSPAMCCIAELEDVIVKDFGGRLWRFPATLASSGQKTIICVLIALYELRPIEDRLRALKQEGHRIILYLFDAWDAPDVLHARRRLLAEKLGIRPKIRDLVDRICLPFQAVYDRLLPQYADLIRHIPLGADSTLVNGYNADRPISILAYGRQLPEITEALASSINVPSSNEIFHHTDHMQIGHINDMRLHRMHFWKMAQASKIALAYDPHLTSPHRVPTSIVGQRWYESLAAGCVVAGRRPVSKEADVLLDWPDATIDLPHNARDAVEVLKALAADPHRLATIREANVNQIRAKHDWRHRIPLMIASA